MRMIDADKLKEVVNADINRCYALGIGSVAPLALFLEQIEAAPTVDAAPVVYSRIVDGACTNCGWFGDVVESQDYKYCPECGCKVIEVVRT